MLIEFRQKDVIITLKKMADLISVLKKCMGDTYNDDKTVGMFINVPR